MVTVIESFWYVPTLNHQKCIAQKGKKSKEVLGLLDGEDTEVILEVKEDPQIRVKDVSEIDRKDLADGWFKLKQVRKGFRPPSAM